MAAYATLTAGLVSLTDSAAKLTFHEDLPEEQDVWVPLSVIEDPDALETPDNAGNVEVSVKKWFLKKNDIPYESDEESPTDNKWK